jgi:phosphatidylserine/phosphatidylglycerophosphate/cardiolipin synthase-like enzyme
MLLSILTGELLAQSVVSWNFGVSSPVAGPSAGLPVPHLVVSDITSGNNNGSTTLLTASSASTGYTGASGGYNAGAAARVGVLNTGANGSASFEFTLTPDFASTVSLTAISFGTRSTSTGPQAYTLRSSLDSYGADIAAGTIANNSVWTLKTHTGLNVESGIGTAVTFRLFGYNGSGSASAGTTNWRIDDLSITVQVTVVGDPGSGIGTASISPSLLKFDVPTSLQFVVKPGTDTINAVRIVKPLLLNWNPAQVTISPDTATKSVFGDTAEFSNLSLKGGDSLVVSFLSATAMDSTDIVPIMVQTRKGTSPFGRISLLPQMLVYGSPRPISQVKQKNQSGVHLLLGKWAVVRGIITVANEFGGPSYLQDQTAGMAVFDSSVSRYVERGDEVVLLGVVAPFNELFEFAPCILLEKRSEGNPLDTLVLTAAQINGQGISEPYEGLLIRLNNITGVTTLQGAPASTWAVTGSGTNYNLTTSGGTVQVRISSRVNLAGLPIPTGTFDMVGVLGQFGATYQILPRSLDDIMLEGSGPRITSLMPYEKTITPTSITFQWTTDVAGSSIVQYGTTPGYASQVVDTTRVVYHEVTVSGLNPATIYHVRLGSQNDGGTTYTGNYVVSTASQNSTGQINVYFNKSINATVAVAETAKGNFDFVSKLIQRIDAAQASVDICMYNLSGSPGSNVANALVRAKGRGVKVRAIGEKDTQGNAPWSTLKNGGIPVIDDGYDTINGGAGLMHNKFIVIDYRDSSETNDWVWTGSWNITETGTNNDMQNVIEIQDKALAGAYTLEFEEMWGSSTDTPNQSATRFGARKLDNTPHLFNIAGTPVELYFSPSDRTTSQIIKTINRAANSINVALLTMTRTDIAGALRTKHLAGAKVRGILDNKTDQGSQWKFLTDNGMEFLIDPSPALFHHKYAIIDAERKLIDNYLITGSHNWSSAAENSNDENTLIIRSARIANLFLQEFKARYLESGGSDNIIVSAGQGGNVLPSDFSLSQNFPNPFNPSTRFEFRVPRTEFVSVKLYDMLGRQVAILVNEEKAPGSYTVTLHATNLASGVYYYRMTAGSFVETKKMLLVR